jgi:hypothetical protein
VLRFTITGGKIVQAEVIADPERLSKLDLPFSMNNEMQESYDGS